MKQSTSRNVLRPLPIQGRSLFLYLIMPKKKTSPKQETKTNLSSGSVFAQFASQASSAEEYQRKFRDDPHCSWDEKEALLLNRPKDKITNQAKSQIYDPRLSTIVFERMNRVMSQHPTGVVRAVGSNQSKLVAKIANLTINNYVIPNANSQYDLLTKFKLLDLYSLVYGSMPMLVDYRVSEDYVGPDCWLIPLRHFLPEANSVSIDDSNYCFIDTWVTRDWLKKRNPSTWKNIDKVLAELDEKGTEKDTDFQSSIERENYVSYGGNGKHGLIHLRTRYERDRWVTVAVDVKGEHGVIRDIANPQHNGQIPIVVKDAFPLLDRFYGLGEFERAKTLQYGINSLWNLYLDGVKMRVYPPMIYNPAGTVPSSLRYAPGAKWIETQPNNIRSFQTGSQSENAFQSTFSTMVASLLNQAGTTNTTTSDVTDPGMGKTPEALKMLGARESSRDAWDRFMMERAIDKTMNLMVDLFTTKQEKPINLDLFKNDIESLYREFPELADGAISELKVFDTGEGQLEVNKELWADTKFKYNVEAGTTEKKDQSEEHQAISEMLVFLMKMPGAMEQASQTGVVKIGSSTIRLDELIRKFVVTSGLQDPETIVSKDEQVEGGQEGQGDPMDQESMIAMDQLGQMLQSVQPQGNNMPGGLQ